MVLCPVCGSFMKEQIAKDKDGNLIHVLICRKCGVIRWRNGTYLRLDNFMYGIV